MLRFKTPDEIAAIQQRIAAQSKVYTHHIKDEQEMMRSSSAPKKNGRPKFEEDTPRAKRDRRKLFHQPESVVLKDCKDVLERHPKVFLWWRQNTGAMKNDNGRYVKFSFTGASDLMAVSVTGRFFACECKATGKGPDDDQAAFLANVNKAGGLGVCVDHAGKLALALEAL